MLLECLRVGVLLATLVASINVAAAPRVWTVSGVQFADGAIAAGYLTYADATQTSSSWNIQVFFFRSSFCRLHVPSRQLHRERLPTFWRSSANATFSAPIAVPEERVPAIFGA